MHLAQINITKNKAPLDSLEMEEFTDFLVPVNKLGEDSSGFVWRLKDEASGESSSYMATPFDEGFIVNMTVWKDIASLSNFVFGTVHSYFLKNRSKWFEKHTEIQVVMWWIPVEHIPTLEEAREKLKYINQQGPTPVAFNYKNLFDADGERVNKII